MKTLQLLFSYKRKFNKNFEIIKKTAYGFYSLTASTM